MTTIPFDAPADHGFFMPAEWEKHFSVFLSWPLNPVTWPDIREPLEKAYAKFAAAVSRTEKVHINCAAAEQNRIRDLLSEADARFPNIVLLDIPTNDAWCRDHGPVFLRGPHGERAAADFRYNAWGGKFPPWDLDDAVPRELAKHLGFRLFPIPMVCEGGALDTNGDGVLLTTESVLMNPNRNPEMTKAEIETVLAKALGIKKTIWMKSGLEGDDTDGHIDTMARFVRRDAVLAAVDRKGGIQHDALERNFRDLENMLLADGSKAEIIPLPCPEPVYSPKGDLLPATYANFLIGNEAVFVPSYRQEKPDALAREIIAGVFPEREIISLDCIEIIQEGGALHCLSQQGY